MSQLDNLLSAGEALPNRISALSLSKKTARSKYLREYIRLKRKVSRLYCINVRPGVCQNLRTTTGQEQGCTDLPDQYHHVLVQQGGGFYHHSLRDSRKFWRTSKLELLQLPILEPSNETLETKEQDGVRHRQDHVTHSLSIFCTGCKIKSRGIWHTKNVFIVWFSEICDYCWNPPVRTQCSRTLHPCSFRKSRKHQQANKRHPKTIVMHPCSSPFRKTWSKIQISSFSSIIQNG